MLLLILSLVSLINGQVPPAKGPYKVKSEKVFVGGYVAGTESIQDAYIWYPTPKSATEKFPFLVFMHGMTAGGAEVPLGYTGMNEAVASWGFIIVAPESCRLRYCRNFYKDGVHTLQACEKNTTIHSSLETADFSHVGVFGHSMGGDATVHLANNPDGATFLAAIAMHPSTFMEDSSSGVTIPLWYTTGSIDSIVKPAGVIKSYGKDPTKPKVIAEVINATHFEPTVGHPQRLTPYVAKYLLCHIKGDTTACPYIYGTSSSSLCSNSTVKMALCTNEQ